MKGSEFIGSCLIGETLIGIARQIHSFENKNPILEKNTASTKIKGLHGKKAICFINKEVRKSKISNEELDGIYKKVEVFIDSKFRESNTNISKEKEDCIEGEQLICESEHAEKDKRMKKMINVSSSHSGDVWEFNGDCCISWIDLEFRHLRDIRSKQVLNDS